MAVSSQRREGRSIEGGAGLDLCDIRLRGDDGDHLHYDRATRTWRTHAELAEVLVRSAVAGSDATPVGAR
jgi:hypothetical protein